MAKYLAYVTLLAALVVMAWAAPLQAQEAAAPAEEAEVVNPYLGLVAFPGSVILEQRSETHDSHTVFESEASLEALYEHFHEQLIQLGWEQTELERSDDEIEARYEREGEELDLDHLGSRSPPPWLKAMWGLASRPTGPNLGRRLLRFQIALDNLDRRAAR